MDSIYNRLLAATQDAYDHFVASPTRPPVHVLTVVEKLQTELEVPADGKWNGVTDVRALLMRNAARARAGWPHDTGHLTDVRAVQHVVDSVPDGIWGSQSQRALVAWIKSVQRILGVTADGAWGPTTDDKFLRLRKQHLNNF